MVTSVVVDDRDVKHMLNCSTCREGLFKKYPDLKAAFESQNPNFKSMAREKVKALFEEIYEKKYAIEQAFNSLPETVKSETKTEFIRILTTEFR